MGRLWLIFMGEGRERLAGEVTYDEVHELHSAHRNRGIG